MPDNSVDPSGSTEAFRAFTDLTQEPETPSRAPLIGGVVAAVIVVAVILWIAL